MEKDNENQVESGGTQGSGKPPKKSKCVDNSNRTSQCPSNYVSWTDKDDFWLPRLNVEDALELVAIKFVFTLYE